MGRKKIAITPIAGLSATNVTFRQRKKGLLNKAKELAVLCHAQVALIIISSGGHEVEQVFVNGTFEEIVQRYFNYLAESEQQGGAPAPVHQQQAQPSMADDDNHQQLCGIDAKDPLIFEPNPRREYNIHLLQDYQGHMGNSNIQGTTGMPRDFQGHMVNNNNQCTMSQDFQGQLIHNNQDTMPQGFQGQFINNNQGTTPYLQYSQGHMVNNYQGTMPQDFCHMANNNQSSMPQEFQGHIIVNNNQGTMPQNFQGHMQQDHNYVGNTVLDNFSYTTNNDDPNYISTPENYDQMFIGENGQILNVEVGITLDDFSCQNYDHLPIASDGHILNDEPPQQDTTINDNIGHMVNDNYTHITSETPNPVLNIANNGHPLNEDSSHLSLDNQGHVSFDNEGHVPPQQQSFPSAV